jgi:CRP/FNR family cyclic AMP-dependent transcriptional regulator
MLQATTDGVWDELRPLRSARRVHVLDADPELAAMLPPGQAAEAIRRSLARVVCVAPGCAPPSSALRPQAYGMGLLILDGVAVRRANCGEHPAAELVGPGDLVQPGQQRGSSAAVVPLAQVEWRTLTELRLAVLDHCWTTTMAAWPHVIEALTARALARAHDLLQAMAIAQVHSLDERLLLLLTHLSARFGTVREHGVVLELPLTHSILAELLVARRPSVSTALRRLSNAGHLDYRSGHWRLIRSSSLSWCGEVAMGASGGLGAHRRTQLA